MKSMVAFFLPQDVARRLYSFAGHFPPGSDITQPQDYHITLAFLPDLAGYELDTLREIVHEFAQSEHPISGRIGGIGRFAKREENGMNPFYTSLDAPSLPGFHQRLIEKLDRYNLGVSKMHGFIPHCTMAYIPASAPTPALVVPYMGVTFNEIWLASGDDREIFSLQSTAMQLRRRMSKQVQNLARVIDYANA